MKVVLSQAADGSDDRLGFMAWHPDDEEATTVIFVLKHLHTSLSKEFGLESVLICSAQGSILQWRRQRDCSVLVTSVLPWKSAV